MIVVVLAILWCTYSCLEGQREARHYHYRNISNVNDKLNEHIGFVIQRIIVWIPYEYIMFNSSNYFTLLNGMCLAFMFTFLHDGVYYSIRNKLDNSYPDGFWSQTTTSTAWFDKLRLTQPFERTIYFIVGIIGLAIINLTIK